VCGQLTVEGRGDHVHLAELGDGSPGRRDQVVAGVETVFGSTVQPVAELVHDPPPRPAAGRQRSTELLQPLV
jgi:hypothetical protein